MNFTITLTVVETRTMGMAQRNEEQDQFIPGRETTTHWVGPKENAKLLEVRVASSHLNRALAQDARELQYHHLE